MRILLAKATLLVGMGGALLAGCAPDEPASSAPPPAPAKTSALRRAAAAKPQSLRANVFLEYSGGMKGFVPTGRASQAATAFQQRVSNLLTETEVSSQLAGHSYQLIYTGDDIKQVPLARMRQVVQGQDKQAALGTELPEMLRAILARPQAATEVSVVVSDFIYGPQNKAKIPFIADEIHEAVASVAPRQLAVAVLAERSAFYGTYFPAVKEPVKQRQLKGEKVPYYIWVIGPPALVSSYLAATMPQPPAEQAYFGLTLGQVPYGALLTGLPASLMPGGVGTVAQASLTNAHDLELGEVSQGVEFTVGLNLSELPPAWQQPALLARQLRVSVPGAVAPAVVPGSVRRLTAAEQAATPVLAAYTHVLRLKLAALPAGSSQLTLALAAPEVPAWVAAWSTDNDNQPGPEARTYRLTDIVRGLRSAYPAALPPVFSLPFSLTNQD